MTTKDEQLKNIQMHKNNSQQSILGKIAAVWRHRKTLRKVVARHLRFIEGRDNNDWGSISEGEELGIAEAVRRSAPFPGPIVEIGTLFGHTTSLIACLKDRSRDLITVDNYCWNPFFLPAGDHRLFTKRTLRYLVDEAKVRIVDSDAQEFYRSYSGPAPSMVFIDADHRYEGVKRDIEWALRMGVPVICGHDYDEESPDVIRAVDELLGKSIETFEKVWVYVRP